MIPTRSARDSVHGSAHEAVQQSRLLERVITEGHLPCVLGGCVVLCLGARSRPWLPDERQPSPPEANEATGLN
jgi:hypothetical protein